MTDRADAPHFGAEHAVTSFPQGQIIAQTLRISVQNTQAFRFRTDRSPGSKARNVLQNPDVRLALYSARASPECC